MYGSIDQYCFTHNVNILCIAPDWPALWTSKVYQLVPLVWGQSDWMEQWYILLSFPHKPSPGTSIHIYYHLLIAVPYTKCYNDPTFPQSLVHSLLILDIILDFFLLSLNFSPAVITSLVSFLQSGQNLTWSI